MPGSAAFLDSAAFGFHRLDCLEMHLLAPASAEGDHRIPIDITALADVWAANMLG